MNYKYKLDKPYSIKQKADFIVKHNHIGNLEIQETEDALYAIENTEKIEEQKRAERLQELMFQLEELDKKRIRAVCEPSMKTENQSWLEYYNEKIVELRQVMAEL